MKKRFVVDPIRCGAATLVSAAFLLFCAVMFPLHRMGSAVVFFLLGMLFLAVALVNGTVVTVDERGISRATLGMGSRFLPWEEAAEVGVCGTRLFRKGKRGKTGTLYIYVSPTPLTDEARFDMVLKWPPLRGYYLLYSQERMAAVQLRWEGRIVRYNAGDLIIGDR